MYRSQINRAYRSILTAKDNEIINSFIGYFNLCLSEANITECNKMDVRYDEITEESSISEVKHAFRNMNLPTELTGTNTNLTIHGIDFLQDHMTMDVTMENVFQPADQEEVEDRRYEYREKAREEMLGTLADVGFTNDDIDVIIDMMDVLGEEEFDVLQSRYHGDEFTVVTDTYAGRLVYVNKKLIAKIYNHHETEDHEYEILDEEGFGKYLFYVEDIMYGHDQTQWNKLI